MTLTVATLETLFVADISSFEKGADKVDKAQKALAKSDPTVKVLADATGAIADIGKVEAQSRKIDGSLSTIKVDADTSSAKADIGGLGDEGGKAGKDAGEGLSAGIIGALVALPVAGSVIGIGVAIGKALTDGFQVEVRSDRLMAQTGLDSKTIGALARASGEAYANNWGTSIAENMDTARVAIQGGLLDPRKVEQDSQAIIESLSGVADILGEEIPAVARATAQILKTGLAVDAQGAFDLLVKGAQAGVNKSEDLLDTFNEYSVHFAKIGLNGPQALGLMSQALQAGARDSDVAADALKEFGIRSVDMSTLSVASFKTIGLNAKDMAGIFMEGGPKAGAALEQILDKIRAIEDPAVRSATAVGLFGTQAEDMAGAFGAMDLSTAVAQLGNVEGAAKSALDTLGDNAAGQMETARRNIEVAADGIKGALATAFAPQIKGFATFVTENREAVMQFLLDMANAAFDAGRSLANAAASGIEGFGEFVGTTGPSMMGLFDSIVQGVHDFMSMIPGMGDAADDLVISWNKTQASALAGFKATEAGSKTAAAAIRTDLITNGLDPAQAKLNAVGIPLVAQAKMHDMAVKLAAEIDSIKQGKVPGINANTAAGKAKIAALQRQIDALNGKNVQLNIFTNYRTTGKPVVTREADGGTVHAAADGARIEAASNGLSAGKLGEYDVHRLAAGGHIPPPPGCRTGTRVGRPDVAPVTVTNVTGGA